MTAARITKRTVVLERLSPADDPVYFDSSTPPSVCYAPSDHESDWWSMKRWWLTPEDFTALGSPERITITIEPGDRLTEEDPRG